MNRFYVYVLILFLGILYSDNDFRISQLLQNSTGFEENYGQVMNLDGEPIPYILFRARFNGYSLFITQNGVSFVFYTQVNKGQASDNSQLHEEEVPTIRYSRFDMIPKGGTIEKDRIIVDEPMQGVSNYYLPGCPEGILGVKKYRRLIIKDVYPGIDWVWDIKNTPHHEFVVHSGADLSQIKLEIKWADVRISEDGKQVEYHTPSGTITDGSIYAWEENGDLRKKIDVRYKLEGSTIIGFEVNGYTGGDIIIDPPLERAWATYFGGTSQDESFSIASNSNGDIYITGWTYSSDFPTFDPGGGAYYDTTKDGNFDIFIAKFNNLGVLEWSTYYGGSDADKGLSITAGAGNIFVTGYSRSGNFPTYNPGGGAYFDSTQNWGADVIILEFSHNGVRRWATFYGGGDTDIGYSIATGQDGDIYVTGYTYSTNFPLYNPGGGAYYDSTHNGYQDAFIIKFSSARALEWSTYLGGSGFDDGHSIKVGPNGKVFLTGWTSSTNFPLYNPGGAYFDSTFGGGTYYDIYIAKFTNSGVMEWSTYYGGNDFDWSRSLAIGPDGNVFITGTTESSDFPTFDPGGSAYFDGTLSGPRDGFILKFSNNGVREWATYFGGYGSDYAYAIATGPYGDVFITGETNSSDLPTLNPGGDAYFDGTFNGYYDVYIAKFLNDGTQQWTTYYGGGGWDIGYSLCVDPNGNLFVTGRTESGDFPTFDPGGGAYYNGTYNGGKDIFLLKFNDASTPSVAEHGNSGKPIFRPIGAFFTDKILVKISNRYTGPLSISLFNVSGQRLMKHEFEINGDERVEIRDAKIKNLPSGLYLLQVKNEGQNVNYILIKLR